VPCTITGGPWGGLSPSDWLYGAEYIPCAVNLSGNFTPDLTLPANTANNPKNTARWLIQLNLVPGQHTIETCLGYPVTHSAWPLADDSLNISRTYVWVGNAYAPPYTEQFQYLGDPRDCPYLDCKIGTVAALGSYAGMAATLQANSYNWWFKDGAAGGGQIGMDQDGYTGFSAAGNVVGWEGAAAGSTPAGGHMASEVDLPRYYETIRGGIMASVNSSEESFEVTLDNLSLGGGKGSVVARTVPACEADLEMRVGLRRLRMQALLHQRKAYEVVFEIASIDLQDRFRLREFLAARAV